MTSLKEEIAELTSLKAIKADVATLKAELVDEWERRLELLLANLALDVRHAVTILGKGSVMDLHSAHKLVAFGSSLTAEQLMKCNIPAKYKSLTSKMREVRINAVD